MDLTTLPITHQATIPESYLDMMGHMNVMWYTHLFAQATGGVFQLLGMNREYFTTRYAGCFALTQHFRYLAEVRVGESVTLRTRLVARSVRKFHLVHFMSKNEAGTLACTGEFLGAHIDMTTRRTAPFPFDIAAKLDRLISQHNALSWEVPLCGAIRV